MKTPLDKAPIGKLSRAKNDTMSLTRIELSVLRLLCQEKTSRETAEILEKSVRTIENHRASIIAKIGCRNIVGVVKYAIKNKIM